MSQTSKNAGVSDPCLGFSTLSRGRFEQVNHNSVSKSESNPFVYKDLSHINVLEIHFYRISTHICCIDSQHLKLEGS